MRVTAFDPSVNLGSDRSNDLFQIAPGLSGVAGGGPPGLPLAPPAPNPSRGQVVLAFSFPQGGVARIEIVDVDGRRVWLAERDDLAPGAYTFTWNDR